ncbi:putative lipoprotein [Escherichia coli]|uniref:Putative lipoprotein n=1 Tax=Escherichia coli TaxID=562 RepID=A0A2X3JKP6_ECOLX|nr:putative lipoprotein [Escherichia coli]
MRKGCFGLVSLALLLLVGCRSHPEIPVNDEQSLVMESSLLLRASVQKSPSFRRLIFNLQHPQRFITKGKNPLPFIIVLLYDARGLEMHPLERPRSVSIPAHSAVTLYGSANFLGRTKSDFIYICKGES